MLRTFPVEGSFCISRLEGLWSVRGKSRDQEERGGWGNEGGDYQVLVKSQSGRCFDLFSGSVDDGQCYYNERVSIKANMYCSP